MRVRLAGLLQHLCQHLCTVHYNVHDLSLPCHQSIALFMVYCKIKRYKTDRHTWIHEHCTSSCERLWCCVFVGVSKRSWQIQIIQDQLEEAVEKFEVLLVSPESTVIGSIDKAPVIIRDSGSGINGPADFWHLIRYFVRLQSLHIIHFWHGNWPKIYVLLGTQYKWTIWRVPVILIKTQNV